ncbi:PTS sugar transporter subunit IIA [Lacticaseibacillus daqingensis]|uniref:PTS sugar transporter subunit IIA n=1 Tax=Lacticaseibacillus daqingensis TaxID=2486014 RepID=UPI000F7B3E8E|nr:PTS sugar transporter subunit IIA [Lacticaseibacillus daqingensis]
MLTPYTTFNAVMAQATFTTPQAVITQTGRLLERGGYASAAYTEAMRASFALNGAYFVIAPGIALPHARPEAGALANGLSVLTLAHPVDFGNRANGPVRLVIGLSATGAGDHLAMLQAVVATLGDRWRVRQLLDCTTSADLFQALQVTDRP